MTNDELLARISALEEENARLEREVRARDEFLSAVSHALRSPLNTLHLQLQVLLRGLCATERPPPAPEQVLQALRSCEKQARRMALLLDLARSSTAPLNLEQLVRTAAAHLGDEP